MLFHADRTGQLARVKEDNNSWAGQTYYFPTEDGHNVQSALPLVLSKEMQELLYLVIGTINTKSYKSDRHIVTSVILERTGKVLVVETSDDKITLEHLPGRKQRSRMIENVEPPTTNVFTVILVKTPKIKNYLLIKAYWGNKVRLEDEEILNLQQQYDMLTPVQEKNWRRRGREYWKTHAYIKEYTKHVM